MGGNVGAQGRGERLAEQNESVLATGDRLAGFSTR